MMNTTRKNAMKVGDLVKHTKRGQTFIGLITKKIDWSSDGNVFDRWAVLYNGQEWNCFALHLEVINAGR